MRLASALLATHLCAAALIALATAPGTASAQSVSTFIASRTHAFGAAFDASGNLYFTQRTPSGIVYRCTWTNNALTLVASGFSDPTGVVVGPSGEVYVADYNYGVAGGAVFKVVGGIKSVFATVPNPVSLAMDPAGNLYVGRWDRIVNKVTPAGAVSVYADMNSIIYLGVASANNHVTGLYYDTDGTLWAAVSWGALFKVAPGGGSITPFNRVMLECAGLTKSQDGFLYGSSYTHNEIWKIDPVNGAGELYAGATNVAGLVNGPRLSARFDDPAGIAAYGHQLYIAEFTNNTIRKLGDSASPVARTTWGQLKSRFH